MNLINPPRSESDFVYHYTKLQIATEHILKKGELRFNSLAAVNDPRESNAWEILINLIQTPNTGIDEWERASRQISDSLKANAKLTCYSMDRIGPDRFEPEAILDRGYSRPSMWHHYADKHRGVCLMFNRAKLHAAFTRVLGEPNLIASAVRYTNEGFVPDLRAGPFTYFGGLRVGVQETYSYVDEHRDRFLHELFFTKLQDWSNESEYRWLFLGDDAAPKDIAFEDSLEAVIIGEGVPASAEEILTKFCIEYSADIGRFKWRNGFPMFHNIGSPYVTHQQLK